MFFCPPPTSIVSTHHVLCRLYLVSTVSCIGCLLYRPPLMSIVSCIDYLLCACGVDLSLISTACCRTDLLSCISCVLYRPSPALTASCTDRLLYRAWVIGTRRCMFLDAIGCWWMLIFGAVGCYRALLDSTGCCWILLDPIGPY